MAYNHKSLHISSVSQEEKQFLSDVLKEAQFCPDIKLSSPFMIRFMKCDFNWDKFVHMHQTTDTPLLSICADLFESLRIPYEDLPLYINENRGGRLGIDFISMVKARLKLGR